MPPKSLPSERTAAAALLGTRGGRARAARMSAADRSEAARRAALIRHGHGWCGGPDDGAPLGSMFYTWRGAAYCRRHLPDEAFADYARLFASKDTTE